MKKQKFPLLKKKPMLLVQNSMKLGEIMYKEAQEKAEKKKESESKSDSKAKSGSDTKKPKKSKKGC